MKSHQITRIAILAFWLIALSAFRQAHAQTLPVEARAKNGQAAATTVRFASGKSALKIPIEIDNHLILMRVRVNGSRPLRFIFDTGASHSGIDAKVAAELGLKPQGPPPAPRRVATFKALTLPVFRWCDRGGSL
jgi:predicted aspartyl protease